MPVKGDGNCFFRAISKVLFNSEDWHPHVRNLFLKYTEANADIFRRFCFSHQLEEHLKRMQYETVWATQLEVFVAASALQLPIYVCTQKTATHEYYWEVFKPQPASSLVVPSDVISVNPVALGIHHIELCHVMRCHYDLLTLSDGTMPLHPPNINPCTDFIDLTC